MFVCLCGPIRDVLYFGIRGFTSDVYFEDCSEEGVC